MNLKKTIKIYERTLDESYFVAETPYTDIAFCIFKKLYDENYSNIIFKIIDDDACICNESDS